MGAEKQLQKLLMEEGKRAMRAKEEKDQVRKYLAEQMQEKQQRRQRDIMIRASEREALMCDIKEAEDEEHRRRRMRKERDMAHRRDIEMQIQSKHDAPVMTEAERKLNQARLE